MRFASARIAARIDFRRNTPTGGSQREMLVQCRRVAAPAEAWSKSRIPQQPSLSAGVGALSNNKADDNESHRCERPAFQHQRRQQAALGRSAGSDINGSGNVCIGHGVSGEAGVDDSTISAM
jgi:hypothetical protein